MEGLIIEKLNVKYTYGALAVSNLSFEARVGEPVAILGGSEAGKTSLLKYIAGLENRGSGKILLNGKDISDAKPKGRNVCFVAADGMFFNGRSVYYNLYYPLKIRKTEKATAENLIFNALRKVGLEGSVSKKKIKKLSNTEKFKVALARCFLRDADVCLIDNPLGELNLTERRENFTILAELLREKARDSIVIFATDSGEECEALQYKTVYLNYGIPLQYGYISEIKNNPCSLTVLKGFYPDCRIYNVELLCDEKPYIILDGEKIYLERERLIDDIFLGKSVVAACIDRKSVV